MTPAAIVDRELRRDDQPWPVSWVAARLDLEMLRRYPEPDRTQLRERWRLALRWGWPRVRVLALTARRQVRDSRCRGMRNNVRPVAWMR